MKLVNLHTQKDEKVKNNCMWISNQTGGGDFIDGTSVLRLAAGYEAVISYSWMLNLELSSGQRCF